VPPTALLPVEEYLRTPYDPDCDYVDGEVQERNLGERDHSDLQSHIYAFFLNRAAQFRVYPFIEQRVQVSPTRFRIPDICLYAGAKPAEQVFRTPPFVAIEVLSSEDRMSRMQERLDDYLRFGVPPVWLIDPSTRRAWVYLPDGSRREAPDGLLRTEKPGIVLPLPEIFRAIDSPS
jgi:Uma2 family endonuclease